VGSGYWGKNLVRNFYGLGALRAICDRDDEVLDQLRCAYPGVNTHLAYNEVLSDDDIRGVVIATPAETHFALAREALLAGKHVFVEKPLALDCDEAESLGRMARDSGLVLMVGHLLHYHSAFIRLKDMVNAGELGRINYIYSNRLNLGKIRREENILWSFAPHDISMILSLAGESPVSVAATGGNYLHREIADVTTTHLEFKSGLRAHVFVSWLHPFKEQKLVVVGEKKMAVFDDTLGWNEKLVLYPHHINWSHNLPVPTKADAETVALDELEPLRCECQHFLECIESGRNPITDGVEGRRVLHVLNCAQQSLDTGGKRVILDKAMSEVADAQVHETAVLDERVSLGEGTSIWHFSHILSDTVIGKNCKIGQNVVIGPNVRVGAGCKIQNNVSVYSGVTLEDNVFCGPSVVFTNVHNPRSNIPKMDQIRSTVVRRGATLGANCTIVCGSEIGEYAFVGAGAVVTRRVPAYALVMGNPARQRGWVCECATRLDDSFICPACRRAYEADADGLRRKAGGSA
jgi:UDP-2-acetamido-3-amino-2,3-dideoxy-glucuronate N-acetyltransferase